MLSIFKSIMDPKVSSLRYLPPAQSFQIMTYLGFMWTFLFCAGAGAWMWLGQLIVFHLLAAGLVVTGLTFRIANRARTSQDFPTKLGTTRGDDV